MKHWKVASLLALTLTFSPAFLASAVAEKDIGLKPVTEAVQQTLMVAEAAQEQQVDTSKTSGKETEQEVNKETNNKETKTEDQTNKDNKASENNNGKISDQQEQSKEQPKEEITDQVKDLTIEEALELARENNHQLKLAELERYKSKVATDQAASKRRHIPESHPYQGSLPKDQARLNETIKEAGYRVADREYDVAKVQIELLIKKNYYDVLKAKDLMEVSKAALERAQEQLRQAEVAFSVGTVAKNDVLGAKAAVSAAQAKVTAAQNNFRLSEITLSRSVGLPTGTTYNLTSIVKPDAKPQVNLDEVITEAQKNRLDILKAEADIEVAEANYDLAVGYTGKGTYDAQQARTSMNQAELVLEDNKKAVVSDLTRTYLSVQAAQKQLDAYTSAVEQSREGLRLAKLRYEVGMATSLEVLTASANLEEMEANRVGALYDHNLAVMSFETAKLAPPQI